MSVVDDFRLTFGRAATVVAEAPGRVNLIGEHTDYNGGFVLPTAIPQQTSVALAARDDDIVRIVTTERSVSHPVAEYRRGDERRSGRWLDYVQGCSALLAEHGPGARGFEAAIASTVPVGAGLSSSAALEVSLLRGLRKLFAVAIDDVALALLAHRVEHDFVGARVGVMDQMAVSLADASSALFLDTRSLTWERVPLPAGAELAVVDSGITHRHAGGGYNARREECERAAVLLGVPTLREVGSDDLPAVARLPTPLDRRVRHVVTENARVLAAVAAMRADDVVALGRILAAGHASLRDDYEVSVPAVDHLVAIASADADVLGARLTGGGFGGAVVVLVRSGCAVGTAQRVAAAYAEHTAGGRVWVPAVESAE